MLKIHDIARLIHAIRAYVTTPALIYGIWAQALLCVKQ